MVDQMCASSRTWWRTKRRTRILDMPHNLVYCPQAPNERQKESGIEDLFEARNPSFFFLLLQVYRILLSVSTKS